MKNYKCNQSIVMENGPAKGKEAFTKGKIYQEYKESPMPAVSPGELCLKDNQGQHHIIPFSATTSFWEM